MQRTRLGIVPCYVVTLCLALAGGTILNAQDADTSAADKAAIEKATEQYRKAFEARDVDGIMAQYAPGDSLFVFDCTPPREYRGWAAYKKDWQDLLDLFPGPIKDMVSDLDVTVVGTVAYSHHIESSEFTQKDGSRKSLVVRVTDVYRKIDGNWLIVLEHVSFPVDPMSGQADLLSKP
jgi:ketosteroid isomerase-like protein